MWTITNDRISDFQKSNKVKFQWARLIHRWDKRMKLNLDRNQRERRLSTNTFHRKEATPKELFHCGRANVLTRCRRFFHRTNKRVSVLLWIFEAKSALTSVAERICWVSSSRSNEPPRRLSKLQGNWSYIEISKTKTNRNRSIFLSHRGEMRWTDLHSISVSKRRCHLRCVEYQTNGCVKETPFIHHRWTAIKTMTRRCPTKYSDYWINHPYCLKFDSTDSFIFCIEFRRFSLQSTQRTCQSKTKYQVTVTVNLDGVNSVW